MLLGDSRLFISKVVGILKFFRFLIKLVLIQHAPWLGWASLSVSGVPIVMVTIDILSDRVFGTDNLVICWDVAV